MAPRAGHRLPAARRPALARSRGAPERPGIRPGDLGRSQVRARPDTAGASPRENELRIGVGSFDPRFHVKDNTVKLAEDLEADAVRYQGNWIPHKIRSAVDDGVFFAGDSAGHCIPLTAEGIRTALYFGLACGRELAT